VKNKSDKNVKNRGGAGKRKNKEGVMLSVVDGNTGQGKDPDEGVSNCRTCRMEKVGQQRTTNLKVGRGPPNHTWGGKKGGKRARR